MDMEAIVKALSGTPHGERRRKIEDIAKTHGIHFSTLYRKLQKMNGKSKTVAREKRISDDIISTIAKIKIRGMKNRRKGRELSTERCIRILERKGIVEKGALVPGTINRRLAEQGFRSEKRRVRFEADYANQCHQIDFSRSEYFEVIAFDHRRDDFVLIADTRGGLYYKNKPEDKKQRLWLVQLKDDYSRVRLVRYFVGTGESTYMGMQFYRWCMTRPQDGHPLRYISDFWMTDQGAFAKSEPVKNLRKALGIEWLSGAAYNKERMGKVERGWRDLWQGWELETSMIMGDKATIYLSDLNDMLHQEMIRELDMQHPHRQLRRGHLYRQSILQHPPREINEDIFNLACRVLERTADIYATVSVDNVTYAVPEQFSGQRVRIYFNMNGGLIGESLSTKSKFELEPYKPQSFLEFRGAKDTYQERMEKETDEELFENIPLETSRPVRREGYFPPQPRAVEPQSPFKKETHFTSIERAREYIGKRLNIPYNEVAQIFDEALETTLEKKVIEEIVTRVRDAI